MKINDMEEYDNEIFKNRTAMKCFVKEFGEFTKLGSKK